MIYAKGLVENNGKPITGAMVRITDAAGRSIMRNAVEVIRETDQEGTFIIPAIESDYITISKAGYNRRIFKVDSVPDIVTIQAGMSTGARLTNTLKYIGLLAPLVSILFMGYQFYLLKKSK
ncbi:hypothetical protein [Edaphocola aurantiacus]|uniref:hypothetical protein n=1 Tax=Edaphocola aurantiacus TaxID=2601682 RepID=UPI001C95EC69|nr:hypothetical protein [Edaphocola aurantiacus]